MAVKFPLGASVLYLCSPCAHPQHVGLYLRVALKVKVSDLYSPPTHSTPHASHFPLLLRRLPVQDFPKQGGWARTGRDCKEIEDAVTFNAQATGAHLGRRPVGRVCDACCTDTEEKTRVMEMGQIYFKGNVTYVC
jgi:hypothetical protein